MEAALFWFVGRLVDLLTVFDRAQGWDGLMAGRPRAHHAQEAVESCLETGQLGRPEVGKVLPEDARPLICKNRQCIRRNPKSWQCVRW